MIRIPNPGRAIGLICAGFYSIVFFAVFAGTAMALEPKQIELTIPDHIEVESEISVQIRLLDSNGKILKKDFRQLRVDIVNNDAAESKQIQLKNGHAKFSTTFKKQGATLITTVDPENKHLVNYSGFTVHAQKEGR